MSTSRLVKLWPLGFLPAAKPAGQWITIGLPDILEILRDRDQRNTGRYVNEVLELISEVRTDLRGRLEAVAEVLTEYLAFGGCENRYRNLRNGRIN